MDSLAGCLSRILPLLLKLQPVEEEYDVIWVGPYYIPHPGKWYPSTFMLYRGKLFASLTIGSHCHTLSWVVDSAVVDVERGLSMTSLDLDQQQWCQALEQLERRLQAAVRNPAFYNRRVQRSLPLSCRTGMVQRSLSWPKGARSPISNRELRRLERAMKRPPTWHSLRGMSLARYLSVVAVAYDVTFKELRGLSPRKKYERRADGRHGGLLDLPPQNTRAFARWFNSQRRSGAHPWEIVFGHPHGILISPTCERATHRWHYTLSVSAEGLFATAVRMALALVAADVPFLFYDWDKVTGALAGRDLVQVGRGWMRIGYDELRQARPDALSAIKWDPIPAAAPISSDQLARVAKHLRPPRAEAVTSSGDADED